jgi:intracellular sulfur oxidation DsrE/DsrF family protein
MNKLLYKLLLITLSILPATTLAASIDDILAMKEAPTGVVVEVIEPGAEALRQKMLKISDATRKIRQVFPELPIAVVSHGAEQFSLTSKNIKKHKSLESNVKQLVSDDVDVHVCGTHASWYGVEPEDYPDYIDVSATGPAQINDYINTGYIMLDL